MLLAAGLFGPFAGAAAPPAAADDNEVVAQFLDRLGLVDLQVMHLENVLEDRGLPGDKRVSLAKKLADLYAAQMMASAGDNEQSQAILRRIRALTQKVPQADTPSLQVMLLQADYKHAESLATRWIGDPKDTAARDEASRIFVRITPQLNDYQKKLNAQADELIDLVDDMEEGNQREAKEKELARVLAVAGRATFYAGWSNYYHGLTKRPQAKGDFEIARTAFRTLLDIEDESYAELDAEWLALESVERAGALIGLALAESAADNLEASRACVALLEHASVASEIQDQAPYWYVQGLLNAGKYDEAMRYSEEKIATYAGNATQGKVSLCASLVRATFAERSENGAPAKQRLGIIGLEGLVRLGQQRAAAQLMEEYDIKLDDTGGFFLGWMKGRRQLTAAERSKKPNAYKAAAESLARALKALDADQHVSSAAQCRYELAWCYFQVGDHQKAGDQYEQAVTGLKLSDPEKAAKSAWMAFASYQKLIKTSPRSATAAVNILKTLKRDFPDHPYAKRADYYINKLTQDSAPPGQTIENLEMITPDDPSYLSARYDICVLRHQLWAGAEEADKPAAAEAVQDAVKEILGSAARDQDDLRKVKCCLLAVDVHLKGTRANEALAKSYLDIASRLVERLPVSSSAAAEYHYRCLQLAGKQGDDQARRVHAEWLVRNAPGSIYEVPALVIAAKAVDDSIDAASESQKQTLYEEGHDLYRRLVERLGHTPEEISGKKNTRIANSKLAQYAFHLGRYESAAETLERLLVAFPKGRAYLRRAGLAHFHGGDYDKALPHWRKLLLGVPNDSEDWYEAKYYQLSCLFETDRTTAEKVMRQLRLLHPDLGPPAWRERLLELDSRTK